MKVVLSDKGNGNHIIIHGEISINSNWKTRDYISNFKNMEINNYDRTYSRIYVILYY